MTSCSACRLELPARARFCARCGVPVVWSSGPALAPWLAVLFGFGTLAGLLFAFGYWALVRSPELMAAHGIDPAQGRPVAVFFALWATLLVAVQALAVPSLLRGASWARPLATAACALWSVTCVGVPISLLVIYLLWRRPRSGASASEPGTLGR